MLEIHLSAVAREDDAWVGATGRLILFLVALAGIGRVAGYDGGVVGWSRLAA